MEFHLLFQRQNVSQDMIFFDQQNELLGLALFFLKKILAIDGQDKS